MRKNTKRSKSKTILTELTSEINKVVSFTQTPPDGQYDDHKNIITDISANDLFSIFTANIIKEETVFTR